MKIDTRVIAALLCVAGKKDIRYYLNGVRFEGNTAIATGGHVLLAIEAGHNTIEPFTVPREACEWAVKQKRATVELFRDRIEAGGQVYAFSELGGNYPQWRAILPESNGVLAVANFAAPLLKALADAAMKLGANRLPSVCVEPRGAFAAPVTIQAPDGMRCYGAIMPQRR